MSQSTVFLLIGTLSLVSGTLLLVLTEVRKLRRIIEKASNKNYTLANIFHQIDDLLTSVKWHTEMMLDKDSGNLNIAQQQMLNKVDTSVADAIQLLKKNFTISKKDVEPPVKTLLES